MWISRSECACVMNGYVCTMTFLFSKKKKKSMNTLVVAKRSITIVVKSE